jgi:hypothetical protein
MITAATACSKELLLAMAKFNEEMVKTGVMLDAKGWGCGPRSFERSYVSHQDPSNGVLGDDDERSYRVLQYLWSRSSNGVGRGRGSGERARHHRAAAPDRETRRGAQGAISPGYAYVRA